MRHNLTKETSPGIFLSALFIDDWIGLELAYFATCDDAIMFAPSGNQFFHRFNVRIVPDLISGCEGIVNTAGEEISALSASDRVVRSAACLSAEVGNETVLMSIESGCYGGLDEIASDIWQRIEKPVSVGSLCITLAAEYDAPHEVIEQDVLAFLDALRQKQMIEVLR